MYSNRSKIIAACLLSSFIGLIFYFSINYVSQRNKLPLTVVTFPKNAHIAIGNISTKNNNKLYLDPGVYRLNVTSDGFESWTETVTMTSIERTVVVNLTPISDKAKALSNKESESEYNKRIALTERDNDEVNKLFYKLNPITKKLPIRTFVYSIGHHMDPTDPSGNSIIIDIDADNGYRQAALFKIRQLGYDPTDFNINFRGYSNPFPL